MRVIFQERALKDMNEWLERHYPEEACGFLLGNEQGGFRTITESWPATNVSRENRKQRFIVDPLDYLRAEKKATTSGLTLLGIYHSHPDHPAIPSEHDLVAAHPFFSYTIVSVIGGKISDTRSYQLQGDQFVEEVIQTEIPGTVETQFLNELL